jgi:hypothetical protein
MDEEIKVLLDKTIKSDILEIGKMDIGSEERKCAIEDLVKIYKLRIDEAKNDKDICERREARIMEMDERREARFMERDTNSRDKQEDLRELVKDRYFRVGIAVAEIGLPLVFYAVWMKRGFEFEESGAYTSTTFRGLFNRFKPTKK